MLTYKEFLQSQPDYLILLSNLKTFIKAVRKYKKQQELRVQKVLDFVDLLKKNNLALWDNLQIQEAENAVNLLTIHGSKGLEFDKVFVIHCTEEEWKFRNRNLISSIKSLEIFPEADNQEDQKRLFYVAITRAKKDLYLSSYQFNENNKEVSKLSFVQNLQENWPSDLENYQAPQESQTVENEENRLVKKMESSLNCLLKPLEFTVDEKNWLRPILENYQLSITHLNNFLDVTNGGPKKFLEINLLRFPQSKNLSGIYGSAMHNALSKFYLIYKQQKELPSCTVLCDIYKQELSESGLSIYSPKGQLSEFEEYLSKGQKHLKIYYSLYQKHFQIDHLLEIDFAKQEVVLQPIKNLLPAKITGKIDKIIFNTDINTNSRVLTVVDYKTGKIPSYQSTKEKLKIARFCRQLQFYKLLVENSRDWSNWQVNTGVLEFLEAETENKLFYEVFLEKQTVENLAKLAQIVYNKIINLDFPDTSKYSKDDQGVQEFITDLLKQEES